jgi:hypothetical protein
MPTNAVGDPTNQKGTLRPNLHPETGTGDHYESLFCLKFDQIINLPPGINRADPLAIWKLFFPCEYLRNIILNTNKKGKFLWKNKEVWKNIDISQLYAYLAILFYMGIYIENNTRAYWLLRDDRSIHITIHRAMGEN